MALYRHLTDLQPSNIEEFEKTYNPGDRIEWSGIYRCDVCGREIVHTNDKPLPSKDHHEHTAAQGKIHVWRLIVTDYSGTH
jgi:hypothetical protein